MDAIALDTWRTRAPPPLVDRRDDLSYEDHLEYRTPTFSGIGMHESSSELKFDVFVSHASEDLEFACRIRSELAVHGWRCFVASEDLNIQAHTYAWTEALDRILDEVNAVILLVSPQALESAWVGYEWRGVQVDILDKKGKKLIPVWLHGISPEELPRALRIVQSVDLRGTNLRAVALQKIIELLPHPRGGTSASTTRPVIQSVEVRDVADRGFARVFKNRAVLALLIASVVASVGALLVLRRSRDDHFLGGAAWGSVEGSIASTVASIPADKLVVSTVSSVAPATPAESVEPPGPGNTPAHKADSGRSSSKEAGTGDEHHSPLNVKAP